MTAMDQSYSEALRNTLAMLAEVSCAYRPAVLANGFGPESMVLTDLIAKHGFDIEIITLDTGRLPEETRELAQNVFKRYGTAIRMMAPDSEELQAWTVQYGPNGFYQSVERRRECCAIRKVAPLKRALAGKKAWLTGLRREQAPTRAQLGASAWDAENGLHKFNPMIDWTTEQVWAYIHDHSVPYNALHDKGYPSIGCAPCTRALGPDEDSRAGRWWWEREAVKECGLHMDPETGRLTRKPEVAGPSGIPALEATVPATASGHPEHVAAPFRAATAANRTNRTKERKLTMKVLVLGDDGFCGWPTALHLLAQRHCERQSLMSPTRTA